MNTQLLFDFTVNKEEKTISVKREFAADLSLTWDCWSKAELLDQWWAPKPYRNETISMNFARAGVWHYAMISPENEKHYCKAYYQIIDDKKMFSYKDSFCNEKGVDNTAMPSMNWNNNFIVQDHEKTLVDILINFPSLEALEGIIKMGFKEGFSMGLCNLDELLLKLKK